jgi:transcriptional regulator with XRE-family HTH domain
MPHDPDDLRVLAAWLRTFGNLSQADLAKRARRSPATIFLYESGDITPSAEAVARLAAAVDVPLWVAEGVLRPVVSLLREIVNAAGDLAAAPGPALDDESASAAVRLGIARFLTMPAEGTGEGPGEGAADESAAADDALSLLAEQALPHAAAELGADFERLVERICDESEHAAARNARLALALARLALRVAQLVPGDAAARARAEAYARGFVANALRVADDLRAADAEVAQARRLWAAGGTAGDGILGEWRLLDRETSLRRDQRRFGAALDCLDRALAPPAARGRLLVAALLPSRGPPPAVLTGRSDGHRTPVQRRR